MPKLGVEQIITLCKIREGIFQKLKPEIVSQLETQGLIERVSSHTNKYVMSQEYLQLVEESSKIGKRYLIKEVENIVMALQNNSLKIGELEASLASSLNRNQIKYLTGKLKEDAILKTKGTASGTKYYIDPKYGDLRGQLLVTNIIADLRKLYETA